MSDYRINFEVLELLRQHRRSTGTGRGSGQSFTLAAHIYMERAAKPLVVVPHFGVYEHLRYLCEAHFPTMQIFSSVRSFDMLRRFVGSDVVVYDDEMPEAEDWARTLRLPYGGGVGCGVSR